VPIIILMSALGFCRECGNLFQKHYRYCPFCGTRNRQGESGDGDAEPASQPVSKKGAKAVRQAYIERLTRLEKRLSLMDQELDAFIVHHR
jgi:hypothetical protein